MTNIARIDRQDYRRLATALRRLTMTVAAAIPRRAFLAVVVATAITNSIGTVDLGIDGDRLTLDGKPEFLLGISYYGSLGASRKFIERDLDDMRRHGFN
jgi:hypothetical protein